MKSDFFSFDFDGSGGLLVTIQTLVDFYYTDALRSLKTSDRERWEQFRSPKRLANAEKVDHESERSS